LWSLNRLSPALAILLARLSLKRTREMTSS
jgi:hypothetical protein